MFRATVARYARQNAKKVEKPKARTPYQNPNEITATGEEKEMLEILRPMPRPPPRTPEERVRLRALMIKYGKFMRRQHLQRVKTYNEFKRAKAAAFDALPNYRRVEALASEAGDFPFDMPIFSHTPPIPGFDAANLTRK